MENWPERDPNGARRILFLLIQTLPTFLGRTDLDFENLYFLDFFGSYISRFPGGRFPNFQKSHLGQAWAELGLGPGWAGPWAGWALGSAGGPSAGPSGRPLGWSIAGGISLCVRRGCEALSDQMGLKNYMAMSHLCKCIICFPLRNNF